MIIVILKENQIKRGKGKIADLQALNGGMRCELVLYRSGVFAAHHCVQHRKRGLSSQKDLLWIKSFAERHRRAAAVRVRMQCPVALMLVLVQHVLVLVKCLSGSGLSLAALYGPHA